MKLFYDGDEYWVEFQYANIEGSRSVTCRIFEPCDRDEPSSAKARGWSRCAPGDRFEKDRGRKVALTRAIRDQPKDFRKAVWAAYLGRKSK